MHRSNRTSETSECLPGGGPYYTGRSVCTVIPEEDLSDLLSPAAKKEKMVKTSSQSLPMRASPLESRGYMSKSIPEETFSVALASAAMEIKKLEKIKSSISVTGSLTKIATSTTVPGENYDNLSGVLNPSAKRNSFFNISNPGLTGRPPPSPSSSSMRKAIPPESISNNLTTPAEENRLLDKTNSSISVAKSVTSRNTSKTVLGGDRGNHSNILTPFANMNSNFESSNPVLLGREPSSKHSTSKAHLEENLLDVLTAPTEEFIQLDKTKSRITVTGSLTSRNTSKTALSEDYRNHSNVLTPVSKRSRLFETTNPGPLERSPPLSSRTSLVTQIFEDDYSDLLTPAIVRDRHFDKLNPSPSGRLSSLSNVRSKGAIIPEENFPDFLTPDASGNRSFENTNPNTTIPRSSSSISAKVLDESYSDFLTPEAMMKSLLEPSTLSLPVRASTLTNSTPFEVATPEENYSGIFTPAALRNKVFERPNSSLSGRAPAGRYTITGDFAEQNNYVLSAADVRDMKRMFTLEEPSSTSENTVTTAASGQYSYVLSPAAVRAMENMFTLEEEPYASADPNFLDPPTLISRSRDKMVPGNNYNDALTPASVMNRLLETSNPSLPVRELPLASSIPIDSTDYGSLPMTRVDYSSKPVGTTVPKDDNDVLTPAAVMNRLIQASNPSIPILAVSLDNGRSFSKVDFGNKVMGKPDSEQNFSNVLSHPAGETSYKSGVVRAPTSDSGISMDTADSGENYSYVLSPAAVRVMKSMFTLEDDPTMVGGFKIDIASGDSTKLTKKERRVPTERIGRLLCVGGLMKKVRVLRKSEEKTNQVEELLKKLWKRGEVPACIMAELLDHEELEIWIDCDSTSVGNMLEEVVGGDGQKCRGEFCRSYVNRSENRIYLGIMESEEKDEDTILGYMADSMAHIACDRIYENGGRPYRRVDIDRKRKFQSIVASVMESSNEMDLDHWISWAIGRENSFDRETDLITAVPAIIAERGSVEGIEILHNQVPELYEFFLERIKSKLPQT
ncbi:mucin-16-like [Ischnura elegans]|uniref:mucin-16-like n=1 Tax=Ischnura elegans TaxID=197161 RepID=UPI001ED888CF|nr:mucin-16-like [Ischnura elegans]